MGCPEWMRKDYKKSGSSGPTTQHNMQSRELFHGAQKMKGYANGGVVYAADGEFISNLPELREPTAADRGESNMEPLREPTAADRGESPKKFGDAFKAARSSGAKEFEWQGKKYTTEMKGESKPATRVTAAEPTTTKFDDGSKMQRFDDGSTLSTGTDGKMTSSKATEDAKPEAKTRSYKMQGRAYKAEEPEKKKFSRFSSGGKYVPSTGVVVKKD